VDIDAFDAPVGVVLCWQYCTVLFKREMLGETCNSHFTYIIITPDLVNGARTVQDK
jgi:hypothetical protein